MRKTIKTKLINLLDSILEAHETIIKLDNVEQLIGVLQDCQEAAIAVGNEVEEHEGMETEIVPLLISYCEKVYHVAQQNVFDKNSKETMDESIKEAKKALDKLSETYHVLFMPYKVSMWDSLESIWEACKRDEKCIPYVVPIPFYEYNATAKKWEYRYEGNEFSENVPVIAYNSYSLEDSLPDIAYIHNPYDNANYVTSIQPDYYSDKLKEYVNKLVYVPYYVTGGFVSPEHMVLPVYNNMDYMVIQSEYAKKAFENSNYYNKLVALGSPKLDKVIKESNKASDIPDDWNATLSGKKVLMLNTSISMFLQQGEEYTRKIKHICGIIKKQEKVALIWRPHPLLEATIHSMRPQLAIDFDRLKEYFIKEKIGVFDQTSDIARAIAYSDGYIGEEESSLVNLFGAANKPLFILDVMLKEIYSLEEKRRLEIVAPIITKDKIIFATKLNNGLFKIDLETRKTMFIGRIEKWPKWAYSYIHLTKRGKDIYTQAIGSGGRVLYDTHNGTWQQMSLDLVNTSKGYHRGVNYKNKIFYLPSRSGAIAEWNVIEEKWMMHEKCIQELKRDVIEEWNIYWNETWGYFVEGDFLWLCAEYSRNILKFNMEDSSYETYEIDSEIPGFSAIIVEKDDIWLAEVNTGDLLKCEKESWNISKVKSSNNFNVWKGIGESLLAHIYVIDMEEDIITVPGYSNGMLKIEKATGKCEMLATSFWENVDCVSKGYDPTLKNVALFGKKLDDTHIITQRTYDKAVAIIDIKNDTYEIFYPELSEEEYSKFVDGDGFEKLKKDGCFARRESIIFSFEEFLDELVSGNLENIKLRQMEELATMAANMDGTCGEKVHEFMMNILEEGIESNE